MILGIEYNAGLRLYNWEWISPQFWRKHKIQSEWGPIKAIKLSEFIYCYGRRIKKFIEIYKKFALFINFAISHLFVECTHLLWTVQVSFVR